MIYIFILKKFLTDKKRKNRAKQIPLYENNKVNKNKPTKDTMMMIK